MSLSYCPSLYLTLFPLFEYRFGFSCWLPHFLFHSQTWWGSGEPIWLTSIARSMPGQAGVISDIRFINITAVSENGALVSGLPERGGNIVSNVTFDNVHITIFQFVLVSLNETMLKY